MAQRVSVVQKSMPRLGGNRVYWSGLGVGDRAAPITTAAFDTLDGRRWAGAAITDRAGARGGGKDGLTLHLQPGHWRPDGGAVVVVVERRCRLARCANRESRGARSAAVGAAMRPICCSVRAGDGHCAAGNRIGRCAAVVPGDAGGRGGGGRGVNSVALGQHASKGK